MTTTGLDPGLIASLRGLDRDGRLLFALRTLRMFGYGFLAGGLKIVYDLLIYREFQSVKPPEERVRSRERPGAA